MVLIDEVCSTDGNQFNCFRLIFIDMMSALMIFICLYSIKKLYSAYQTLCFEIICLSTAIVTVIQILEKTTRYSCISQFLFLLYFYKAALQFSSSFFDQHMYMTFTSFYMQLVTYTIISFSFIKLYYKLQRKKKRER